MNRNIENVIKDSQNIPVFISRKKVEEMLNLSRSVIYSKMDKNNKFYDESFPTPIKFGTCKSAKVAWIQGEVIDYMRLCIERTRGKQYIH